MKKSITIKKLFKVGRNGKIYGYLTVLISFDKSMFAASPAGGRCFLGDKKADPLRISLGGYIFFFLRLVKRRVAAARLSAETAARKYTAKLSPISTGTSIL